MKHLILIALIMTADITSISVDYHNKGVDIEEFKRKTINFNSPEFYESQPIFTQGINLALPQERLIALTDTSSSISANTIEFRNF